MITFDKPHKFWKGKKRLACKAMPKAWTERLNWGLSLKVGDIVGTCEGSNRQIEDIKYVWSNYGSSSNSWVSDVLIFDRNHNKHYLKIDNCLSLAYSLNQVVNYYENLNIEFVNWEMKGWRDTMEDASLFKLNFLDNKICCSEDREGLSSSIGIKFSALP